MLEKLFATAFMVVAPDANLATPIPPQIEETRVLLVAAEVPVEIPAKWRRTIWLDTGACERTVYCNVLSQFADTSKHRLVAKARIYGGPPQVRRVVRVVQQVAVAKPEMVNELIVCDIVGCKNIRTFSNGEVKAVPQYKIYAGAANVREFMSQLAIKGAFYLGGPAVGIPFCALVRTDFDEHTAADVGMNGFRCSPLGFIDAQKDAVNGAERAFIIGNGLIGLGGLFGLPLPDEIYTMNSLAGTFAPLVDWKKLGTEKNKQHK